MPTEMTSDLSAEESRAIHTGSHQWAVSPYDGHIVVELVGNGINRTVAAFLDPEVAQLAVATWNLTWRKASLARECGRDPDRKASV